MLKKSCDLVQKWCSSAFKGRGSGYAVDSLGTVTVEAGRAPSVDVA